MTRTRWWRWQHCRRLTGCWLAETKWRLHTSWLALWPSCGCGCTCRRCVRHGCGYLRTLLPASPHPAHAKQGCQLVYYLKSRIQFWHLPGWFGLFWCPECDVFEFPAKTTRLTPHKTPPPKIRHQSFDQFHSIAVVPWRISGKTEQEGSLPDLDVSGLQKAKCYKLRPSLPPNLIRCLVPLCNCKKHPTPVHSRNKQEQSGK